MPDTRPALSLAETVTVIGSLAHDTAVNILRIGQHLLDARRVLGRDFPAWSQKHFAWTLRDIRRFIRVAQTFAAVPPAALERCDPTALYLLAERSTPPAVRDTCLEAASAGTRVTTATVRAYTALRKPVVVCRKPTRVIEKQGQIETFTGDGAIDRLGWAALSELCENGTVTICRVPDDEESDDAARPWVVRFARDGKPAVPSVSKDSLASALTLAAGTQPERDCRECGTRGPLFDAFSRKQGNPMGRSFNCRRCETKRVGDAKKQKRGTATDPSSPPSEGRHPKPFGPKGSPAGPPAGRRVPPND